MVQSAQNWHRQRATDRGLNRWSNVHIADVAALYALVITRPRAGTFMYVESGEEALGEIVRAIAARLDLGAAQSWAAAEAIAAWGRNMAVFSLGSNSRVRGKAAADLGWSPSGGQSRSGSPMSSFRGRSGVKMRRTRIEHILSALPPLVECAPGAGQFEVSDLTG
jgi:hypothetical protein